VTVLETGAAASLHLRAVSPLALTPLFVIRANVERHGVRRDYAHLAVAFCRSLNIPARYCTGYITDIGLPPPYAPMDFAAWIEVYLGGRWHTFDPRNNAPRIGCSHRARSRCRRCTSHPHLRSRQLVGLSRLGRTSARELTLAAHS
jgi:hypothetical protein